MFRSTINILHSTVYIVRFIMHSTFNYIHGSSNNITYCHVFIRCPIQHISWGNWVHYGITIVIAYIHTHIY